MRVGGAPDTFLGAGLQTCRDLIDAGGIGEPVAAAWFLAHGQESWHPDPAFFYQPGGGPMFDMGPYYLTALIALLGPVRRVTGQTRITFPQRTITSKPKYGEVIDVEVPTHVTGILEFATGAVGTVATSFDVWRTSRTAWRFTAPKGACACPTRTPLAGRSRYSEGEQGVGGGSPLARIHREQPGPRRGRPRHCPPGRRAAPRLGRPGPPCPRDHARNSHLGRRGAPRRTVKPVFRPAPFPAN